MSPNGRIQREYESLVNPERDMGPTRIHRISAEEVLQAPKFHQIAGDILDLLRSTKLLVGHNISFDRNFLVKEYERIGITLPDFRSLCTCQMLGRSNLQACCAEIGISFDGEPHCALHDARATARLIQTVIEQNQIRFDEFEQSQIEWPSLPRLNTTPVTRSSAHDKLSQPSHFLQRIVGKLHHDVQATSPDFLAYLTLIDRFLEDRALDANEAATLLDVAKQLNLDTNQVHIAHRNYIQNLAVHALADGVITDGERNDLYHVARLLGYDPADLNAALNVAARQLQTLTSGTATPKTSDDLRGKTVCFTGELHSEINGQPISRDMAHAVAEKAGLIVVSSVTRKLDILVVADPNTQSGKAKKARQYGIRILAEPVFWRMIGVSFE